MSKRRKHAVSENPEKDTVKTETVKSESAKQETVTGTSRTSKVTVYVIALVVLSFAVGFMSSGLFGYGAIPTGGIVGKGTTENVTGSITADEAGTKAVDYINSYLVQTGEATLKSSEMENDVYKVTTTYQDQDIDIYVTLDGTYMFLSQPVDINVAPEIPQDTSGDIPTAEKTSVKFFVMSYCPYGNQAEDGLAPVYTLLKDKVDWEPHYVIYSNYGGGGPSYCLDEENKYCSMHGIQELNEDVRELCMWKSVDHDTWWAYVIDVNTACTSSNVDTCWEAVAQKYGIDTEAIKTCQQDEAMDLLANELALDAQYGVSGSPTVLINNAVYSGSRDPEAYKAAICSGFENPPEECSQTLSGSGTAAAGECG